MTATLTSQRKFRKKPVVIDAVQWFPGIRIDGVMEKPYRDAGIVFPASIRTLEGYHGVSPGDWIITGIKGEKYPCKPDVFEKTYDPV